MAHIKNQTILVTLNITLSLEELTLRGVYDILCRVVLENIMFCLVRLFMNRVLKCQIEFIKLRPGALTLTDWHSLKFTQTRSHTHTRTHSFTLAHTVHKQCSRKTPE